MKNLKDFLINESNTPKIINCEEYDFSDNFEIDGEDISNYSWNKINEYFGETIGWFEGNEPDEITEAFDNGKEIESWDDQNTDSSFTIVEYHGQYIGVQESMGCVTFIDSSNVEFKFYD